MDSNEIHQLMSNGSDVSVQLLADHGQHDLAGNYSDVGDNDDGFFRIYFSSTRFTAETVIAMTSAGINAAVLTTLVIALTTSSRHCLFLLLSTCAIDIRIKL